MTPSFQRLTKEGGARLQALGVMTRLEILARAGARFTDPADPLRQEAEARVPEEAALSRDATCRLLDALGAEWSRPAFLALLKADFPDPAVLDGFQPGPVRGSMHRAIPPRLLVQYASGNVPGTGATALLRALLVGAPSVLKPGRGDQVLPELVARALLQADPQLADTFVLAPWRGGEGGAAEAACLRAADLVVIYGGAAAVEGIRALLPPTTPVRIYGPRISGGIVLGARTLDPALVEAAADAVCAYEQRGCVSPQVIWVQDDPVWADRADDPLVAPSPPPGTTATPAPEPPSAQALAPAEPDPTPRSRIWAAALAGALDRRRGLIDPDVAVAQRSAFEEGMFDAAHDPRQAVFGGPDQGWLVLYTPTTARMTPTCLGRTVRVHGFSEPHEIFEALEPMAPYLQTLAVEGDVAPRRAIAERLALLGVTRITSFAAQPWPPASWREDGEEPLRTLVRWSVLEPVSN
jgi:hypothetical protein